MIVRSQKVIESIITPIDENTIEFKRNYGVGYLDGTINRIEPFNEVRLHKSRFNYRASVNGLDEIKHNIHSQWSFFEEIKSVNNLQILMLPSYMKADKFQKLQQSVHENEHLNGLEKDSLDSNFGDILESQENWADPGHLNRLGGIHFSKELKKVIGYEN
jgi:hypothetical protein